MGSPDVHGPRRDFSSTGGRLPLAEVSFRVVDLEATGLEPFQNDVIEAAVSEVRAGKVRPIYQVALHFEPIARTDHAAHRHHRRECSNKRRSWPTNFPACPKPLPAIAGSRITRLTMARISRSFFGVSIRICSHRHRFAR